jgi:plastocyanin
MNAFLAAAAMAALVAAAPPAPPAAIVRIDDFAYRPATLTVTTGTVVRFVNDDAEPHTVTATGRTFDSGGLDTGDAWTHRFDRAGTYAYFCALHPYMKGSIVVRAGGSN